MIFLQLFYEFFKIGLFAVGGGMATIPFLMDLTSRYSWFTMADLTNMIAVSESTPGPIGINMATYAGFNAAGIPGALCATLSLVLPAWIIIILIAKFMSSFSENKYVKGAFYRDPPDDRRIDRLCSLADRSHHICGYKRSHYSFSL